MKRTVLQILLVALTLSVTACGGGAGGAAGGASGDYNTDFPLPSSVSNFTETGGAVNFQTKLNLHDSVAFYRESFSKGGLTERTINTSISETTFSMVFDGDPSGRAIVVQGVDLGNGTTNINIRFEDV